MFCRYFVATVGTVKQTILTDCLTESRSAPDISQLRTGQHEVSNDLKQDFALLTQFCAKSVLGLCSLHRESRDGIAQLLKHLYPPTALQHLPAIQALFMSVHGILFTRSYTGGISQVLLKMAS